MVACGDPKKDKWGFVVGIDLVNTCVQHLQHFSIQIAGLDDVSIYFYFRF